MNFKTTFYVNRDGHSEIYTTFISLLLAKKSKKKCRHNQVDFIYIWLDINKTNVEIYKEVLRDVSQNIEGKNNL